MIVKHWPSARHDPEPVQTYDMQSMIVGYKANRLHLVQDMFEAFIVQGMVISYWPTCRG